MGQYIQGQKEIRDWEREEAEMAELVTRGKAQTNTGEDEERGWDVGTLLCSSARGQNGAHGV